MSSCESIDDKVDSLAKLTSSLANAILRKLLASNCSLSVCALMADR